ncbi:MAG TPA: DUF1176 domain-containing protein, partial [Anaerolineales bacterium]|nr:DUF1176 domain-containing protein [Anaerolineales bacterium]
MKIRLKFVVLLWLGVCLLGCVSITGTKAPSSPTSSPTWTPTSSPQETPVASPTVFSSPTPLPTARPSLTPSPTPATQVDPDDTSVTYAERPAWRALLGWPDACEEGFELHARQADDEGGIVIYPLDDRHYLILVTCTLGPYWVEERVYWLDASASPPAALSLAVPELIQDDAPEQGLHEVDVLHGAFPTYHPDTQTLTNLHAYRGLKDCGVFYKYHLEDTYFVLDEARYRDCESGIDTLMPG